MISALRDMLDIVADNSDRVVAANNLLDLLLKSGAVAMGLIAAVKWLGGKKPEKVEKKTDGFTSITSNNTTILVDNRTVVLLEDLQTREALEDFSNRALGIDGLSSVRLGEKGEEPIISLAPSDRASFKVPEPAPDETISEFIDREVLLKIITSHFRDGYKWRFTDGGERPFTADIEDTEFLNEVLQGKTTLSANDTLRCQVREEQRLSSAGLSKEIKVIKVLEHIVGAKQLKLL